MTQLLWQIWTALTPLTLELSLCKARDTFKFDMPLVRASLRGGLTLPPHFLFLSLIKSWNVFFRSSPNLHLTAPPLLPSLGQHTPLLDVYRVSCRQGRGRGVLSLLPFQKQTKILCLRKTRGSTGQREVMLSEMCRVSDFPSPPFWQRKAINKQRGG